MPTTKTVTPAVEHRTYRDATTNLPKANCRLVADVTYKGSLMWKDGWKFCPYCGERLPTTLEEVQLAS